MSRPRNSRYCPEQLAAKWRVYTPTRRSAVEFLNNSAQNALAFGRNETTRSDFRIFNSDGGTIIRQMAASNDFYLSTCKALLERMVNTVPSFVKLTAPIEPIRVKPIIQEVYVFPNATIGIRGFLRVGDLNAVRRPVFCCSRC